MESRKRGHLRIRVGKQRPSKKQIAEILAAGLEPEFRVVDEQTTQADSLRSETDWVKRLARQGIRVTNQWREHREWIEALASRQSPL
jgi:2-succinyl-5-enolpyruvyl-6-hydroxy-3-cyclohexene-1-carboxylate synthase